MSALLHQLDLFSPPPPTVPVDHAMLCHRLIEAARCMAQTGSGVSPEDPVCMRLGLLWDAFGEKRAQFCTRLFLVWTIIAEPVLARYLTEDDLAQDVNGLLHRARQQALKTGATTLTLGTVDMLRTSYRTRCNAVKLQARPRGHERTGKNWVTLRRVVS